MVPFLQREAAQIQTQLALLSSNALFAAVWDISELQHRRNDKLANKYAWYVDVTSISCMPFLWLTTRQRKRLFSQLFFKVLISCSSWFFTDLHTQIWLFSLYLFSMEEISAHTASDGVYHDYFAHSSTWTAWISSLWKYSVTQRHSAL